MGDSSCSDASRFAKLMDDDNEDALTSSLDAYRLSHSTAEDIQCLRATAALEKKGVGIDVEPIYQGTAVVAIEFKKGLFNEKYDLKDLSKPNHT